MFSPDAKVFASRFWGFNPVTHPIVMFGKDGNRDRLRRLSEDKDLVLFVGTKSHPTPDQERGRLLGLVEFARIPVEAVDLVNPVDINPWELDNGKFRWPKAFPITRAWRISDPRPLLTDVLERQLDRYATVGVVQLSEVDRVKVLQLQVEEIELPLSEIARKLKRREQAFQNNKRKQTTGPSPTNWKGEVTRNVSVEAYTYAMRFGRSNIWKIGWTNNIASRLAEVNAHVPQEHLQAEWRVALQQRWQSGSEAYQMEQAVLHTLGVYRTIGERVECTEIILNRAWYDGMLGS